MRSFLSLRIKFSWAKRKNDFDVHKKPPKFFGELPPASIHLAGDKLTEEKREAAEEEKLSWKKLLVAEDSEFKTHR